MESRIGRRCETMQRKSMRKNKSDILGCISALSVLLIPAVAVDELKGLLLLVFMIVLSVFTGVLSATLKDKEDAK